jgi:AraC-like DNA-binding protein
MLKQDKEPILQQIRHNCYITRSREGEQFVPEHVFSYQIAGTLQINDGIKTYTVNEGDFRLSKRNQLVKFVKQPPLNGEYKALSIYLDQDTLRAFSMEYGLQADRHDSDGPFITLKPSQLFKSFVDSLLPYQQSGHTIGNELQRLKLREAILILLQANPELKDILFDFSEPGKIDLEGFMNKNYHFNIQLKRFAYLTGRSLATFKRDFDKIFHITPSRWLQQRRLQEAHYLIKERGQAPSDVYLELGFEDLSHFSFAFKKTYGVSPSRL